MTDRNIVWALYMCDWQMAQAASMFFSPVENTKFYGASEKLLFIRKVLCYNHTVLHSNTVVNESEGELPCTLPMFWI